MNSCLKGQSVLNSIKQKQEYQHEYTTLQNKHIDPDCYEIWSNYIFNKKNQKRKKFTQKKIIRKVINTCFKSFSDK